MRYRNQIEFFSHSPFRIFAHRVSVPSNLFISLRTTRPPRPSVGEPLSAFGGKTIALARAVGLVRQGHLKITCSQGRLQVGLPEMRSVFHT